LALTLVRSVGWLSRRDMVTRGVGAGPDLATPDAQCLGTQRFEFRLGLLASLGSSALLREAAELRRPALVLRGHGEIDAWRDAVQFDNPHLQVSAFRRCGDQLELRVWNPTAESQDLRINGADWEPYEPGAVAQPGQCVKPFGIASFRKTL
jgi:mannosylglycerate hydrolase